MGELHSSFRRSNIIEDKKVYLDFCSDLIQYKRKENLAEYVKNKCFMDQINK